MNDEHPAGLVPEQGRRMHPRDAPPAGVGGDFDRLLRGLRFDYQLELRHRAQAEPRVPAEQGRYSAYEQRFDTGTLPQQREEDGEPVEQ